MKTARDIGLLFRRYAVQLLRNPVWLVVGFSTPILYLALFTPLLKHLVGDGGLPTGNVLDLFLPGILALLAFASGVGPGFSTIFELKAGRHRAVPGHPGQPVRDPDRPDPGHHGDDVRVRRGRGRGRVRLRVLGALGRAGSCWPCCSACCMIIMAAFSIATALVTKDISGFAAIINGINLPVLLLAGVLLPISLGPAWMRVLAHFNPLYYLVQASRVLAGGTLTGTAVWQAFAVLVPLCVAGRWPGRPRSSGEPWREIKRS